MMPQTNTVAGWLAFDASSVKQLIGWRGHASQPRAALRLQGVIHVKVLTDFHYIKKNKSTS
jgi:hypothetical protein